MNFELMTLEQADQMAMAARYVIDIIKNDQLPADIDVGIATDDYLKKLYTPEQVPLIKVAMLIAQRKKKVQAMSLWEDANKLVEQEAKNYGIL